MNVIYKLKFIFQPQSEWDLCIFHHDIVILLLFESGISSEKQQL